MLRSRVAIARIEEAEEGVRPAGEEVEDVPLGAQKAVRHLDGCRLALRGKAQQLSAGVVANEEGAVDLREEPRGATGW